MTGIFRALLLPFSSIPFTLKDPILRRFILIPLLVNIAIFLIAIASFTWLDHLLMSRLTSMLGTGWWVPLLTWVLGIILFIAFGAGMTLSFTFLANLIGGIFFETLSQRTENRLTSNNVSAPEGSLFSMLYRNIREEIKGMLFFLLVWIGLLAVFFIPVIGQLLFPIVSFVWAAIGMSFEFIGPMAERHGWLFKEKQAFIRQHLIESIALGSSVFLMAMIPVVNLAFMPFAVVAGTRWLISHDSHSTNKKGTD